MNTQVSFTTDLNLKKLALEKAKKEGITLKTLLIYAMKGFVEGKISLGLETKNTNSDIEEIVFNDSEINNKAKKIADLIN